MMKIIEPTKLEDQYLSTISNWSIDTTFKSVTGFSIEIFLKLYQNGIIKVDNYELLNNMINTSGVTHTINFFQRFNSQQFKPINDKPKKSLIIRFFDFWRGLACEDYIP